MSIMKDSPDVNQRIAARVRELRAAQGLSLDALDNGVQSTCIKTAMA